MSLPELLWQERNVRCEVVPLGAGRAVELRSSSGSVFLRKPAPTITAARNEAEYLRLLIRCRPSLPASSTLKPFVLIVEDEPDTADAYREALRFIDVRSLPVATGREALRHAADLVPDLIILDYRLPDVHGRDLCAQFRSDPVTAAIPILVVTASPQDSITDYPDAVLSKPCLLPTLLAASRLLLHRALPGSSRGMAAPLA